MTDSPRGALVLVVDDDDDVRLVIETILQLRGFRVATAADGAEALALMRRAPEPPSLVVLDLMMPGMNGYDFRAEQQRDPALAGIPVVVLTGYGNAAKAAATLGVEAINKPVELEALVAVVRRLSAPAG